MPSHGRAHASLHIDDPQPLKPEPADVFLSPSALGSVPGDGKHENHPFPAPPTKISESPKPREALNREMYRIPSYAGWFSWGKIHAIERQALPEFFDGLSLSKTPKVYKEYREFVINKYRENPKRVLTFTEVRKMLVGDVNLLKKVYDFLQYWGLINFHVTAENKSNHKILSAAKSISNHDSVVADANQQEKFTDSVVITASETTVPVSDSASDSPKILEPGTVSVDMPMERHEHSDASMAVEEAGRKSQVQEKPNDSQLAADDWTIQETLRLLEAIAKYGENWSQVAHHVNTKSKMQCIKRFIRLPFGDQFFTNVGGEISDLDSHNMPEALTIENDIPGDQNHTGDSKCFEEIEGASQPPTKRSRLTLMPLADSSNPILAQVAFLLAMVGSRVATAAAQAAVAALSEEDPVSLNHGAHGVTKHHLLPVNVLLSKTNEMDEDESLTKKEDMPQLAHEENGNATIEGDHPANNASTDVGATMSAASANAKLLADHYERETESIITDIIEKQFKQLQKKLDSFEELEFLLEREHSQIARARFQLLADWIRYSHYHYNSRP